MLIDFDKIIKSAMEETNDTLKEEIPTVRLDNNSDIVMVASMICVNALMKYHKSLSSILKARGIDVDSI